MEKADIGLIGLAVMGQNLVLNINDHGFKVAVYNRTTSKIDEFLKGPANNTAITGAYSIAELIAALKPPRVIMLMVKAGEVVDKFIEQLVPHLEPGDIIIDGGNSNYTDTNRRVEELAKKSLSFLGTGISGGEEGARNGPSIMPGGNPQAWQTVKPILQAIAAKVDGEPCCQWVGENGAGHYVKMVHNGIEYGDMQLISEAYQLMREGLGLSVDKLQSIFAEWNQGVLDSYLIEITSNILGVKDTNGAPQLDKILDTAGQKGTGKWTGIDALDLGIPLTLISEAVFARCLSARKEERIKAAQVFTANKATFKGNTEDAIAAIHDVLYASKIISYAQGYMLMREAAKEYGWKLNYGDIALMWRGGCIIRSKFLGNIKQAFEKNPELENLLLDDFFATEIKQAEAGWRKAVTMAIELGIPTPAFSSALAFYDGIRRERLPANLLQAQRDYFGAHTYERVDKPRGEFFHTDWTGHGGKVSSTTYEV
ncbi:MAG: phosphogluconate dehydrogenase (NADP(+)-dependent, decarboxylating) [Candidatus Parabeggiatoa sp. nov. 2]|nr:MAG: phosphogluconate dehydrogenase (NADP(+)-dependent, decarboxylating) [Beggiatoa sp. 4572_84]RKZ57162.1 MAG: phosphogluconate dehydrogenase (NADP(+)-dependent, decarboxylating) [Gammaproteobacteria bacterium]HEC86161.1 decarboxylating NADP(+)-dependent phosphogluconate dehydrogenase [Thioploca sp.]